MGFESANVPTLPSGQYGGLVSSLSAIPSWTAFYGTNQTSQIKHNNFNLGDVNISIIGPSFTFFPILQGGYSVLLQSGLVNATTQTPAAIAQTGSIPASTLSLRFLAKHISGDPLQLKISIGGQVVPFVSLATTATYDFYGADISQFAGQTRELKISSLPTEANHYNYFVIDSISFSDQQIPEPNALSLLTLGVLLLSHRTRLARRW